MATESSREISFVIEKHLGILSQSANGWRKELTLVSWNGKPAKLDVREWSPDYKHMSKGLTLRHEEAWGLQKSLYRWLTGYGKPAEASSDGAGPEPLEPEIPEEFGEVFPAGPLAEVPEEMPSDVAEDVQETEEM